MKRQTVCTSSARETQSSTKFLVDVNAFFYYKVFLRINSDQHKPARWTKLSDWHYKICMRWEHKATQYHQHSYIFSYFYWPQMNENVNSWSLCMIQFVKSLLDTTIRCSPLDSGTKIFMMKTRGQTHDTSINYESCVNINLISLFLAYTKTM